MTSSPDRSRSRFSERLAGVRNAIRYGLSRRFIRVAVKVILRVSVEGRANLPAGPAVYCFNHLGWIDPFVLTAILPDRPRLYFFGPKEEDMSKGSRNRLLVWSGMAVPFRPGKDDLLETTRRVRAVFDSGGVMAIAGEGRIHIHEGDLLPLQEGAAYFALRSRVPIVPIAVNGTSWVWFRAPVQVRIGEPIPADGRPNRENVDAYTALLWHRLRDLVADSKARPVPRLPFGRWLTDAFNDWGPGGRPAAALVRGPRPDKVPLPVPDGPREPRDAGAGPAS